MIEINVITEHLALRLVKLVDVFWGSSYRIWKLRLVMGYKSLIPAKGNIELNNALSTEIVEQQAK